MRKKILLFILTLLPVTQSFAQEVVPGDIVSLKQSIKTTGNPELIYSQNLDTTKSVNYLETFIQFEVIGVTDNIVKLRALDFKEGTQKSHFYNKKIYSVNRSEFDKSYKIVEPVEKFSLGLISLPFKVRPQTKFSYSTEFNLNGALNYNIYTFWNTSINYQAGLGLGSVSLNTSNSNGVSPGQEQNVSILSILNGLMLQHKSIQVGIYLGVDYINNQEEYQWNSNGNLWFGIGIGYDIFTISTKKPTN
jgi:hypothetical protein